MAGGKQQVPDKTLNPNFIGNLTGVGGVKMEVKKNCVRKCIIFT
jgi:hypothetical protein